MKKIKYLLLILFIIPSIVFAYSDYIIAGGDNIGIQLNSKYIIIAGTYNINNINPAKEAGLIVGDKIIKINNKKVNNIKDMQNIINNLNNIEEININYLRNNKEFTTKLKLVNDNNVLKSGLYIKDNITGIGTLTFIDPTTKRFGALGHEIIDKTNGNILEISDGNIFESKVTNIIKSDLNNPGEKNAKYYKNIIKGNIIKNTNKGIFGKYNKDIDLNKKYKVGKLEEIKEGKAKILTVINNNDIKEYEINIIKVNKNLNTTKNILFEITDEELLNKTGGIIQGMSGSPIIQDDKIIGAVTHVIINDPKKGYGISIIKMLEEIK